VDSKYRLAIVGYRFMERWPDAGEIFRILRDRGCGIDFLDLPVDIDQRSLAKSS
jgi:hypothetical protein